VRDFEQLFGGRVFDDGNCYGPTGCDSDADLLVVRTIGFSNGSGHMHNWLKTCGELTSRLAVRVMHSPAIFVVTIILLGSMTLAQSAPNSQDLSGNDLARRVIANELKFQDEDHAQWAYRQEKEESGKKQIKRIIETKDGALSRLLSVDDHPLTANQLQKENQRIQELVSNPAEQRKLQRARNTGSEPGRRLFKMLPDAFVFNYAGRE